MFERQMLAESGGNPRAHNPSGASGLMQLLPATGAQYGAHNLYDPNQNLNAGAAYMHHLLQQYGGDARKALAAYNAGPGNVQKYHGIPPFRETQNYVNKIAGDQSIPAQVTRTVSDAASGFMSTLKSAGQGAKQLYTQPPAQPQPMQQAPLPQRPPETQSTKSLIDGSWQLPQQYVNWETGA